MNEYPAPHVTEFLGYSGHTSGANEKPQWGHFSATFIDEVQERFEEWLTVHDAEVQLHDDGPSAEEWRRHIADERARQAEGGYDAEHDRLHGVDHLLTWAQDYARRGKNLSSAALIEAAREVLASGEPSEAQVAAAVRSWAVADGIAKWDDATPSLRSIVLRRMRGALRAAGRTKE